MFLVALIPLLLGILVAWGGYLGWAERLPRDRGAGVRTAATLRNDDAFRVANKVAGLPTMVGGAIGIAAGAGALAVPGTGALIVVTAIGLLGLVGLVAAGGLLGHKAATAVPDPSAPPPGCTSCACGGGGCGVLKRDQSATAT